MTQLAATAATISGDGSRPAAAGDPDEPPRYRTYRARPRFMSRSGAASLEALRRRADQQERAQEGRTGAPPLGEPVPGGATPEGPKRARRRPGAWRVVRWVLTALAGWVGLSVVLFLFSAQFLQDRVDDATRSELTSGGGADREPVDGADPRLRRAAQGLARARRADERARAARTRSS